MTNNMEQLNKFDMRRWLPPIALLTLALLIWLLWLRIDPRLAALRFITAFRPPRNYLLGICTLDLFADLHASFKFVGWISLSGAVLTLLVAWLKPRLVAVTAFFAFAAIVSAFNSISSFSPYGKINERTF